MDLSNPSNPRIDTVRDSRRLLQMVNFRNVATGEMVSIEGNAEHRSIVSRYLNLFNDGEPRADMGWRVREDMFCVRLFSRTTRLPYKVSYNDIKEARKVSVKAGRLQGRKALTPVGMALRIYGFGLMRRTKTGWYSCAPTESSNGPGSARGFFCAVEAGELEVVLEPDAYMPGSRGKAAEHQEKLAQTTVAATAAPAPQLDIEGHLAAILKLLQGAPYIGTIDGARIQIIPPIREGYRDPDPELVLAKVFHEDRLLPKLQEAARRERPIVYYEIITELVGYELDPKSPFYLTTVLQAFSRALSTAAGVLRRDRIMVDRSQTRKAPLANGAESKQVLFRRM